MEDIQNPFSNYIMSNYTSNFLRNSFESTGIAQMMQQLGLRPEPNIQFSTSRNTNRQSSNNLHSQFHSKIVCQLYCKSCDVTLCRRGMKAILLADTKVELYSTDTPPKGNKKKKMKNFNFKC